MGKKENAVGQENISPNINRFWKSGLCAVEVTDYAGKSQINRGQIPGGMWYCSMWYTLCGMRSALRQFPGAERAGFYNKKLGGSYYEKDKEISGIADGRNRNDRRRSKR